MLHTFIGHTDLVNAVAVTSDGRLAISGSWDTTLKVWDLERGTVIAEFYCEGKVLACGYSNFHNSIIAGDETGRIHILRLEGISQDY